MHEGLAKALFRSGAALRNPSLTEQYERVKKTEWLRGDELREVQLRRAAEFLEFAGSHSPYYRRVFRERGFDPGRFSSIDDLAALPTVTKSELIASNAEIHADAHFHRTFRAETSGTSGAALEFQRDERWDSVNRAHMMRSYDWYGIKPWHRSGYLWGYDIDPGQRWKVRLFDTLQNRFRIFTYDRDSVRRFAAKLRSATYLDGYSSMIYEVAKIINEMDVDGPRLKLVKGTSEMILPAYQPAAEAAFGRRIVSEYGAAEAGLIAFECPEGSMHINAEDVIVETGPDDEVIVTNLASRSFPVIRYRLGDMVQLGDEACACGRAHPVISEIIGRKGATVEGRRGRYPAFTFYYVFKNLALQESLLLNYKAVQTEPGSVVIYIEGRNSREHEGAVRDQLTKYFADDVRFELRFVEAFDRSKQKMQSFESRL